MLGVILNNQRPGVVRYPTWIMRRALKRVQGNDGRLEPPQVVISGASRCFNEEAAAVDDGKTCPMMAKHAPGRMLIGEWANSNGGTCKRK